MSGWSGSEVRAWLLHVAKLWSSDAGGDASGTEPRHEFGSLTAASGIESSATLCLPRPV